MPLQQGRQVLADALEHVPGLKALWEAAVAWEESAGGPGMAERVLDLYDRLGGRGGGRGGGGVGGGLSGGRRGGGGRRQRF